MSPCLDPSDPANAVIIVWKPMDYNPNLDEEELSKSDIYFKKGTFTGGKVFFGFFFIIFVIFVYLKVISLQCRCYC